MRWCLYHARVFLETAFSASRRRVLPELLVERPTGDAETAGGLALVSLGGVQNIQDRFPLDHFEGMAFGAGDRRCCRSCRRGNGSRQEEGELRLVEILPAGEDDPPLHGVHQLPDVSRPGVAEEPIHRLRCESLDRLVVLLGEPDEKLLGQKRDVFRSSPGAAGRGA